MRDAADRESRAREAKAVFDRVAAGFSDAEIERYRRSIDPDEKVFENVYDVLLLQRELHDNTEQKCFFRGQYDARWPLIPRPESSKQFADAFPSIRLERLSPLQREAVVQHYMSGTRMLAFTRSVCIAAHYATLGDAAAEVGAIYRIERGDFPVVTSDELPAKFLSIQKQKAVFVSWPFGPAERWAFFHTTVAQPFESAFLGITTSELIPVSHGLHP